MDHLLELRKHIRLNAEHNAWDWFASAGIPENISPPIKPVIEKFKRL